MCAAPLNGSNSPTLDFSSLLASYFNHVSSAQTSELNSLQVSSSSSALSCLSTAVQHYTSAIEILFTLFKNFTKFHCSSAAMDAKDKKEFSSATAMKQLLEEKIGRTEKLKAIVKKTEEKLKANAQPGAPTAHNDVNPQPAPSAMTVEEKEEEDMMNDLGDLPPTLIPKVNSFPAIPPPSYAEATTPSSASASSAAMFSSSTASASTSSSSSSAASSPPLLPRQSSLSVLSSIPSSVLSSFSSSSWDSLFGLDSIKKQMFDTLLPPFVLPSYTLPVNCVLLHGPPLNSKSLAMHSFLSIFNPNHFFLIESSMWRSDLSSVIPMLKDTFTESKTHETKDRKNPNNVYIIFIDDIDQLFPYVPPPRIIREEKDDDDEDPGLDDGVSSDSGTISIERTKMNVETIDPFVEQRAVNDAFISILESLFSAKSYPVSKKKFLIVAASSNPWNIEDRILRYFSSRIYFPPLDFTQRTNFIKHYLKEQENILSPHPTVIKVLKLSEIQIDQLVLEADGYTRGQIIAWIDEAISEADRLAIQSAALTRGKSKLAISAKAGASSPVRLYKKLQDPSKKYGFLYQLSPASSSEKDLVMSTEIDEKIAAQPGRFIHAIVNWDHVELVKMKMETKIVDANTLAKYVRIQKAAATNGSNTPSAASALTAATASSSSSSSSSSPFHGPTSPSAPML